MPWSDRVPELLAALDKCADAVERFVLTWCFVEPIVAELENAMAPVGLYELAVYDDIASAIDQLTWYGIIKDTARQAAELLALVATMDEQLSAVAVSMIVSHPPVAIDGSMYCVIPARPFPLAGASRSSSLTRRGAISYYAPQHTPIAGDGPVSIGVEMLDGTPLGARLAQACAVGAIVCHPLGHALSVTTHDQSWEVAVVDTTEASDAVRSALAASSNETVLVLPELSLEPGVLEGPGGLRAQHDSPFPILTVAGLHHHLHEGRWVNVAIVVDRYGTVIHRHHKLTRVDMPPHGWEIHETGNTVTVFPSQLGTLAVAICKDLFGAQSQPLLAGSRANVVLVPSLSPKTNEHVTGAHHLRAMSLAATFVSNRWGIEGADTHPAQGASFALVPGAHLAGTSDELHQLAGGAVLRVDWNL
jgi:predicted amidohydrolase